MIRGLYSSAAGMDVQQARMESVSNNLANASTPGYKKEAVRIRSFPEMLIVRQGGPQSRKDLITTSSVDRIGSVENGAMIADVSVDHAPGMVQETGKKTDIMIKGPGFFSVSAPVPDDPQRVCYTRNGAFTIDSGGYLATPGGHRVLGDSGEIMVGGGEFTVASDGSVESEGTVLDRLRLVEFDALNGLRREGDGLFADTLGAAGEAVSSSVCQGFLEKSNVNVVDEMVDLISTVRAYEANQKLIQSHDELLAKAA
ncbi:MAG TPA: flagellar hook-basal body protein, partial [Bacillota bacterium]|nr:flagellar hook-basal body protein [Bacillota bacterium]